jgi:hypothetical protein
MQSLGHGRINIENHQIELALNDEPQAPFDQARHPALDILPGSVRGGAIVAAPDLPR